MPSVLVSSQLSSGSSRAPCSMQTDHDTLDASRRKWMTYGLSPTRWPSFWLPLHPSQPSSNLSLPRTFSRNADPAWRSRPSLWSIQMMTSLNVKIAPHASEIEVASLFFPLGNWRDNTAILHSLVSIGTRVVSGSRSMALFESPARHRLESIIA